VPDAQIYNYAPIKTRAADLLVELGKMLLIGGTYRFEVAAVDQEGRISPFVATEEIVARAARVTNPFALSELGS